MAPGGLGLGRLDGRRGSRVAAAIASSAAGPEAGAVDTSPRPGRPRTTGLDGH